MILGLDISTSITGATVLDSTGKILYNEAWDTRKFKYFFEKVKDKDRESRSWIQYQLNPGSQFPPPPSLHPSLPRWTSPLDFRL